MDEEKVEEKIVEERKRKIVDFLVNKKILIALVGLAFLLFLAWHIRTANVPNLKDITTNDYTLGPDLDPFVFLRYAKYINDNGRLMELDNMRNVPLGFNTKGETKVLPYMIVYFHKIISPLTGKNITYSAIFFPAFAFLLTAIAFFLFISKVFEDNKYKYIIALIASAFLIVSPSLLPRTVAGIPEKESVAFLFTFLAFYFFLSAWKSEKLKTGIIFAFFAGLSTGLMGLVWGGVKYIYLPISLSVFLAFVFGKTNRERFFSYLTWILVSFFMLIVFFPGRYTLKAAIADITSGGLGIAILFLLLVDILIFKTKIKDLNFIKKLRDKIPDKVLAIGSSIVLAIIISTILINPYFVPNSLKAVYYSVTRSGTDRLSFTVAENKEPYFGEWANNFGPMVKDLPLIGPITTIIKELPLIGLIANIIRELPLIFLLFFIGSIFLFHLTIKKIGKRGWILTAAYIIFLFSLIFSRYSPSSSMNGVNNISKIFYFGGYLLMIVSSFYIYYKYFKENKLEELNKISFSYLFLLIFFIISLIGARSAIRLVMVLVPSVAGIVGFFVMFVFEKAKEQENKNFRAILYIVSLIIIFAALYSFYSNYQTTLSSTKGMIPSVYTQQWQTAMAWVRNNTPKDAVFSHWWDYGYWIQSIGERATVLDGGNVISYWNHLLGRHVLTGQTEKEALEFLYAHNASHLLIDSTDIGKYPAYSSIGSDENYDRYSQIPLFIEDEKSMQEGKNETIHLYRGGMFLDQDYLSEQNGVKEIFPAYKSGIGGVFLRMGSDGELRQPYAVFVYQGKQINVPMRYAYFQGKLYDFGGGYEGSLYIIPALISDSGRWFIKETGQALFISEKSMKALWVKLYLFNNAENFELVHKEDSFIARDLKKQGAKIGDFVIYGDVQGPIKIWKINYPENITFKQEYLKTEYPESLRKLMNF